ncbi:ribonuclease-like [Malaclemys terrapin pileata]|uniref:ribonuclease-like n=1 Tax=Malaclemys terrapin pileata TaxID=2991368 RepID=UPI0023A83B08|nr:ribonuclease-like [Malaclemys terrapin pileata]
MALKAPRSALLPLLCLAASCLALSTADAQYDKFLKRHLDFPKSWAENDHQYCTTMMGRRSIRCQGKNTFVHANEAQLRAVCSSGTSHGRDTRDSLGTFRLTVCTRLPKGLCLYQGSSTTARIRLVCRNGSPVQYLRRI